MRVFDFTPGIYGNYKVKGERKRKSNKEINHVN